MRFPILTGLRNYEADIRAWRTDAGDTASRAVRLSYVRYPHLLEGSLIGIQLATRGCTRCCVALQLETTRSNIQLAVDTWPIPVTENLLFNSRTSY